LFWTVENGLISNGQGTSIAQVSWFSGDEGSLILTAHDWQSGCESSDSLTVIFDGEAPAVVPVEMLGQNTTVLYCSSGSFPYYRWGYTSAETGLETSFNTNLAYYEYNQIDVLNYYYWVEYGVQGGCITRSYYNAPPIIINVSETSTDSDFVTYPNPVIESFTIASQRYMQNTLVEILSSTGKLIERKSLIGTSLTIDISGYATGMYFVRVIAPDLLHVLPLVKQ
jgi:hypothetical protein